MARFSTQIWSKIALIIVFASHAGTVWAKQAELVIPLDVAEIEVKTHINETADFVCKKVQWLNQSGEPRIPWQVMTVLLPPDALLETVEVRLKHPQYEPVDGLWDVAPTPPVATHSGKPDKVYWPKDKNIVDGRDVDIYRRDAVWPHFDVQLVSTGRLRKWKLAQIALPLIKYNPVGRNLRRLVSGELEIHFDRTTLALSDPSVRAQMRDRIGEDTIKKIAVNYEKGEKAYEEAITVSESIEIEGSEVTTRAEEDPNIGYVVITTSEIQSASMELSNFANQKESKGFDVQVITEADFNGGVGDVAAENIRAWLQAHYRQHSVRSASWKSPSVPRRDTYEDALSSE